jgi:hypothetical protein
MYYSATPKSTAKKGDSEKRTHGSSTEHMVPSKKILGGDALSKV